MIKYKLAIATSLLVCISATGIVHAQEEVIEEETGSGVTVDTIQQQAAEQEWQRLIQKSTDFREDLKKMKTIRRSYLMYMENVRTDLILHRQTCRKEIRLSSSYYKLDTVLDCYRQELVITNEKLQKQREYVEKIPGISDDVRWLTLTRMDLLMDALKVIVNAIDSDVYQSVEELQEVKINLLNNYRKPNWLMMTRLQANRLLMWAESLITRAGLAEEQEELSSAATVKLLDTIMCLKEVNELLNSSISSQDLGTARMKLKEGHMEIRTCVEMFKNVYRMHRGPLPDEMEEEVTEEETAPEKPISRRLLRRLTDDYRIK